MLLRQIQHFQAVVENKSFTEAAVQCHISQSAISQSIKAVEDELGVPLLIRKNRSFELTEAGQYFYEKSLDITSEIEKMCRETIRIGKKDKAVLSLGILSTYSGNEFNEAVATFAKKYPAVDLKVLEGNHEDLYEGLINGTIDLALNDQRRLFSDHCNNIILKKTFCYVEMATYNPLSKGDSVNVEDLRDTPCILVASEKQEEEERRFYHDIIGFHGDFIVVRSLQEARIHVVANQGVMSLEGSNDDTWFGASMKRLILKRDGQPVARIYCAFYMKDNSGYYVEEFADILKSMY